eukprot:CAMPEP_0184087026 /NCGR_PEP_ID=MMETSP0974-20121125/5508_1 /TAXON_ID=483370 /ORGANISM="non described non described, Strain CCMP2097" /LENGTH=136 /DNA_ID=CAMNT_0026389717 /DNA_START=1107 /DNA_END=1513 /DNA_ORIENTATION=-
MESTEDRTPQARGVSGASPASNPSKNERTWPESTAASPAGRKSGVIGKPRAAEPGIDAARAAVVGRDVSARSCASQSSSAGATAAAGGATGDASGAASSPSSWSTRRCESSLRARTRRRPAKPKCASLRGGAAALR